MIELTFHPGDIVRVHQKIREGDKERIQIFEGIVIAIKGRGVNKMFTVRKIVDNVAVERIWPFSSPLLGKIVVKAKSKKRVRRAKLYYLRQV